MVIAPANNSLNRTHPRALASLEHSGAPVSSSVGLRMRHRMVLLTFMITITATLLSAECNGPFIDLPIGWQHQRGDSIDSSYGDYVDNQSGAVIRYDIGFPTAAGEWTKNAIPFWNFGPITFGFNPERGFVLTANEIFNGVKFNWNFSTWPKSDSKYQRIKVFLSSVKLSVDKKYLCY